MILAYCHFYDSYIMLQTSPFEREVNAKQETPQVTEDLREQFLKERNEFFDLALHDIQSPVRRLSTLLERLFSLHEIQQVSNATPYIERIKQVTAELHSLTKGLASLYEAESAYEEMKSCDLNEVVWSAIDELKHHTDIKPSQFQVSKLPLVYGNFEQLKMLFINIFHNAVKFQKPGTQSLISIESSPSNENILPDSKSLYQTITVRDNGIGIRPEQEEKIFEPFVRLNGKSSFPGSGLGLAVCKKIIEKHKGRIDASPGAEGGCVITITLPQILSL